ncbi:hypothetical protein PR202_ga21997 [Eleusine coracana subsp. coracana]|uniref:Secreted protein n=1 Tax=Eleusine coracana subsp. coracana TaxID=191504 RepID=A0AAV5D2R9_ELECO|nr:hypothetical protein PR202_ga21997 [Eleusine coracana subsp. coracana]
MLPPLPLLGLSNFTFSKRLLLLAPAVDLSPSSMALVKCIAQSTHRSDVLDERPDKRQKFNTGREPPIPASLWAGVHPDILGIVLPQTVCVPRIAGASP